MTLANKPIRFEFVKKMKFTRNWNQKLFNTYFTTIRLKNDKYILGADYSIIINEEDKEHFFGIARIVSIKEIMLNELTNYQTYLDSALSKSDFIKLIQNIYNIADSNLSTIKLQLLIFQYQTK